MDYLCGVILGLTVLLSAPLPAHTLVEQCATSVLDQCLQTAYDDAGITTPVPNTDTFFVSPYGIIQLSVIFEIGYNEFCVDIFPLLELDRLISCIRPHLQRCSDALLSDTAAQINPDASDRKVREAFLRIVTDLLYWSNHFLATYVKRICDEGCDDLPQRNNALYECLSQDVLSNLQSDELTLDQITHNSMYCQTVRTLTNCIWSGASGCFILQEEMFSLIYFFQHIEFYNNFATYWQECGANPNMIPPVLPGAKPCNNDAYYGCIIEGLQEAGAELGYEGGDVTEVHKSNLNTLVDDHSETCRYMPDFNMETLQHCILDSTRGCLSSVESLYAYSNLHRLFHWLCRDECANYDTREGQIRGCDIHRLDSNVEQVVQEIHANVYSTDILCSNIRTTINCVLPKAHECPLLWDDVTTELNPIPKTNLLMVEQNCTTTLTAPAEPCGYRDRDLAYCIELTIPEVVAVIETETLQEILQIIVSFSIQGEVYCEDFHPYIDTSRLNGCIRSFQARCDGSPFSVWMDRTRPTLDHALNDMCDDECFQYGRKATTLGQCYLDGRQIDQFRPILIDIATYGRNEPYCFQLLAIDDCALTQVGECEPLRTLYNDQLVVTERLLAKEGVEVNVRDELQHCRDQLDDTTAVTSGPSSQNQEGDEPVSSSPSPKVHLLAFAFTVLLSLLVLDRRRIY